jgi:hypothetical protein
MEKALIVLTHPDGDIALFNDAMLGDAPESRHVVKNAPVLGKTHLTDAGYIRLDGGSDVVIFDCGPCGPDDNPGHAHADFLSVELSISGERFLVDPGVASYEAGQMRDLSRSAASHNGPHIEGLEPMEFWKAFRVGFRGCAHALDESALPGISPLECAGYHDGYMRHGSLVFRYVGFWPGKALIIADRWVGKPPSRAARTTFLVPHNWAIENDEMLCFNDGNVQVRLSVLRGSLVQVTDSCWWPRDFSPDPARQLQVDAATFGSDYAAACLFQWDDGEPPAEGEAIRKALEALTLN